MLDVAMKPSFEGGNALRSTPIAARASAGRADGNFNARPLSGIRERHLPASQRRSPRPDHRLEPWRAKPSCSQGFTCDRNAFDRTSRGRPSRLARCGRIEIHTRLQGELGMRWILGVHLCVRASPRSKTPRRTFTRQSSPALLPQGQPDRELGPSAWWTD